MELSEERITSIFLFCLVFLFAMGGGGSLGGGGGAMGACVSVGAVFGVFNKVIVLLTTEYG